MELLKRRGKPVLGLNQESGNSVQSAVPGAQAMLRQGGCVFRFACRQEVKFEPGEDPLLQAVASDDISDEAALRMLKAKVTTMQDELKTVHESLNSEQAKRKEAETKSAVLAHHAARCSNDMF